MTENGKEILIQKAAKPVIATTAGMALAFTVFQFGHSVYSELRNNITRIEHTMAKCVARNEDHLLESERWKDEIVHHRNELLRLDRLITRLESKR